MLVPRSPFTAVALLAVVSLLVTGCSGSEGASRADPGVTEVTLAALQISPAEGASVPLGGAVQFAAIGTYSDGSTEDLTAGVAWASSNPAAATVSSAGLATSVAAGTAEISASLGELASSATLEVLEVASLDDISPTNAWVLVGTTLQLTAWGTLADGSGVDLTGAVTWTSGDDSVATISETGLVSALVVGETTITAAHAATATTASTLVFVTDEPHVLAYVSLDKGSVPGGVGVTGTVALTSPAEVDTVVTLSSADPLVTVPPEVVILAGEVSVTFPVTTEVASANMTHVTISASDGTYERTGKLNVRRTR